MSSSVVSMEYLGLERSVKFWKKIFHFFKWKHDDPIQVLFSYCHFREEKQVFRWNLVFCFLVTLSAMYPLNDIVKNTVMLVVMQD